MRLVGNEILFSSARPGQIAVENVGFGTPLLLDVMDPLAPIWLEGGHNSASHGLFLPLLAGGGGAAASAGPERVTSAATGTLRFAEDRAGARRYYVRAASTMTPELEIEKAGPPIQAGSGADLIIIAPAPFHSALQPLVAHRAAQGLRVRLVDAQLVYDTWSHSRLHPAAIRDFLAHAFGSWPRPAPAYVLLVGDGSHDFRNVGGNAPPFPLPPFLAPVDPWLGETASDMQYVRVSGQDRLPDMMIGRIPARTAAEVTAVVDKIRAYEGVSAAPWLQRALLVADDDATSTLSTSGTTFAASAERVATSLLPPTMEASRLYYNPAGGDGHYREANRLRSALRDGLAQGSQFVIYFGHSSYHQWAEENFLHLEDLQTIDNKGRYPVVLGMSCFTGAFHLERSLDEGWLLQGGRGAIATWSATGLGVATGHDLLIEAFLEARFDDVAPVRTIGEAVLAAQLALVNQGRHLDLLDTYHLFGDPTLRWKSGGR